MRVIVGYGNSLRGEDAFGVDCIKELEKCELKEIKLISTFQLTPEIVLELLEANEIIFIDACYSLENQYKLCCGISKQNNSNLTHHITPFNIITILNGAYKKYPKFYIYSMLTNSFDGILDIKLYNKSIKLTISQIII
ncbi:MAG: hypothetical protein U9R16_06830 [Campylobacterota bacterium]|nr:hypothetical protein [Campylobacterota bacterium]